LLEWVARHDLGLPGWWCGDGLAQKEIPSFGFRIRLRAGHPVNAPVSRFLRAMNTRTLKIEAIGDFFRGKVSPRIRLTGQWLERAGVKPGHRVEIHISQPGTMTLRFLSQSSLLPDEASGGQRNIGVVI
jgi:hypothetical protein